MSGPFGSSQWMYNAGGDFYDFPITNSLRFNDDDSAYLNFTPGTAGNRKTFTFSCWLKHSGVDNNASALPIVWGSTGTVSALAIAMSDNRTHSILFYNGGQNNQTTALFRDSSAWYHFVLACDTTQSTATNRTKLYVNGVAVTAWESANYPAQNTDGGINAAGESNIGKQIGQSRYFDGYMAEVNQIDGLALGPDSFGEFKNDIWIPKNTSGLTFGDQGYRLQFKQTGTGTASSTTIGADTSGNDNHWTSNNLVASDVVPDSPTNNFATYNAVDNPAGAILSEGNLKCTSDASYNVVFGTISFSSGKYYWEQNSTSGNAVDAVSVATTALVPDQRDNNTGNTIHSINWYAYSGNGSRIYWNGTLHVENLTAWGAGDVMSVACDMDNKTIQFRKNNVLIYTASSNANGNITNTWDDMIPAWGIGSAVADKHSVVNFGQDSSFAGQETAQGNTDENGIGDFYYAPPSGYLALCTANLPDPVEAIDPAQGGSPQDYFNTVLYTGNATQRDITGVGFQPDWTWIKQRSGAYSHVLGDSVRGDDKFLSSNTTGAEETDDSKFRTFVSDGFQVGTHSGVNQNTQTYASWNWKAGTAFSNDASSTSVGNTDSTGSVSADTGFSIISWTGVADGSTRNIAHGLGAVPKMIIVKNRERAVNWAVYHVGIGNTKALHLDTTSAAVTDASGWWDSTTPTSTVFTTGHGSAYRTGGGGVTEDFIAYCFAEVDGYSKFGSYTGNGNADGTFVYTGFRPAWILIKKTSAAEHWAIWDVTRSVFNPMELYLLPSLTNTEVDPGNIDIDVTANGFKIRNTWTGYNASGGTYIYMAFAEQPFKYANAR